MIRLINFFRGNSRSGCHTKATHFVKHVLITGGAGFIGSHLVERLLADGERVVVIDDFSTGNPVNLSAVAQNPQFRCVQSKVSTCAELPELVAAASYIFHLAAAVGVELVVQSPLRTIETNLHESEVILAAAAQHRVPVLFASTSEVYGKSAKPTFREDDDLLIGPPTLGRWSYACSKLMDEFLALAYWRERGLPVTIVRLFNTVGPRQTGRFGMVLPRFVEAAKAGRPLRVYGDGQQTRCFCHVFDTVTALVHLQHCSAARGEVVNVGGECEITVLDLAAEVIRLLGSISTVERVPYEAAYAPGFEDMRRRRPDVGKLRRFTGFIPARGLPEMIQNVAAGFV